VSVHVYEIRSRKDRRGFDQISAVLPYGRLWYGEPDAISNAIGYAKSFSRSHDAVIRVFDEAGNVIETHERASDFGNGKKRRAIRPPPAKSPGDLNAVFNLGADPSTGIGDCIVMPARAVSKRNFFVVLGARPR
jgi:hypothetical protein